MADIIDEELTIEQIRQKLIDDKEPSWPKDHEQRLRRLENQMGALVGRWAKEWTTDGSNGNANCYGWSLTEGD